MNIPKNFLSSIYLIFAFFGAILPTLANIQFIQDYGLNFDIALFIKMANINPAARSLSRDLAISSSAFLLWIIVESRRIGVKNMWLIYFSTFTIAFAFSAPLFLFLRERRLIEIEDSKKSLDDFPNN